MENIGWRLQANRWAQNLGLRFSSKVAMLWMPPVRCLLLCVPSGPYSVGAAKRKRLSTIQKQKRSFQSTLWDLHLVKPLLLITAPGDIFFLLNMAPWQPLHPARPEDFVICWLNMER